MSLNLMCGMIGVGADQKRAIELAARHGFESVEPSAQYLAGLTDAQNAALLEELKAKKLVWGAAGLPLEFRQDNARFQESVQALPRLAAALERAGVDRISTWISPAHNALTYLQNFHQHATRLREAATVLKDHNLRLGLEYVGTLTARISRKFPFIHCMAEMRELIGEINTGNVGLVLDSWHWWTAEDTEADLLSLSPRDVVAVDLNDAPAGVPKAQQLDGRRELPAATGIIDAVAFLRALERIGYDGPVRAEPFNRALNDLPDDEACAATAESLRRAFALAGL